MTNTHTQFLLFSFFFTFLFLPTTAIQRIYCSSGDANNCDILYIDGSQGVDQATAFQYGGSVVAAGAFNDGTELVSESLIGGVNQVKVDLGGGMYDTYTHTHTHTHIHTHIHKRSHKNKHTYTYISTRSYYTSHPLE